MKSSADVIVVGGGPAGTACAIGLAQRGYAVTLLDRARFPRDKACGEFLTPQACKLLQDLGVWDEVLCAGARPVAATTLIAPNGESLRHAPSNGKPAGYTLRRVVLDAVLINAAKHCGVDVREGFAVRNLLCGEHGEVCGVAGQNVDGATETLTAKLVIGADGSHSLVARQRDLVRPLPRLQRVAIVSHWHNVSGKGDSIEMRSRGDMVCGVSFPHPPTPSPKQVWAEGESQDRILPSPPALARKRGRGVGGEGEVGESPVPLNCNVTLVVPTSLASQIAGRQGDFVEQTLIAHFPDLANQLSGAERESAVKTVGCFGHRCKPAVADGVLLVGDAATFIDPFTGEGVYFALRGAELVAQTADFAFRVGDFSSRTLSRYDSARSELKQRYLLCDLIQGIVRRPALISHVIARLKHSPDAADCLLSVLGDTRQPKAILNPQLLWRLLAPEISR